MRWSITAEDDSKELFVNLFILVKDGETVDIVPEGIEEDVSSESDCEVGPVAPVCPVCPVGLIEPVDPVGLVGSVGPVGLVSPVGPLGPVGPVGPLGLVGPVGPVALVAQDHRLSLLFVQIIDISLFLFRSSTFLFYLLRSPNLFLNCPDCRLFSFTYLVHQHFSYLFESPIFIFIIIQISDITHVPGLPKFRSLLFISPLFWTVQITDIHLLLVQITNIFRLLVQITDIKTRAELEQEKIKEHIELEDSEEEETVTLHTVWSKVTNLWPPPDFCRKKR